MNPRPCEDVERQAAGILAAFESTDGDDLDALSKSGLDPAVRAVLAEAMDGLRLFRASAQPKGDRSVPAGFQVSRFCIEEEIGRGAFGVVFRAVDTTLNRVVAIKVPRPEALATADLMRRFLREAQLAAKLDHPNIVAVYEAGESNGLWYIASACCNGPSLAAYLRARGGLVSPSEAAAVVRGVASGVAFAHANGVIHRDIKPSNILLEAGEGERVAVESAAAVDLRTARPKLTDFGLARLLDVSADGTVTGGAVGTPVYMAPEFVEGGPVDERADIYSLGVVLYELLTGETPFRGTREAVYSQILLSEAPSTRKLNPVVPRDLDVICRKCLEKNPRDRYASAQRLIDDLDAFLDGRPIAARPVGSVRRVVKWCRRKPTLASVSLALAVVAVVAAASVLTLWRRAERHLAESRQQQRIAEHRFVAAQRLVDDFFTAESDDRADVGILKLRNRLTRPVETLYEDLFGEPRGESDVSLASARAWLLYVRLLTAEHKGPLAASVYSKAKDAWLKLCDERGGDSTVQAGLAQLLYARAAQLASWRMDSEALAVLDEISARWPEGSPAPLPNDIQVVQEQSDLLRVPLLIRLQSNPEMTDLLNQVVAKLDNQIAVEPASELPWRRRMQFTCEVAKAYRDRRRFGLAYRYFTDLLEIALSAEQRFPSIPNFSSKVAEAHCGLGRTAVECCEWPKAVLHLQEARRISYGLMRSWPHLRFTARRAYWLASAPLEGALEKTGDQAAIREIVAEWAQLLADHSMDCGDHAEELSEIAYGHTSLASALDYLSEPLAARNHYRQAIDQLDQIQRIRALNWRERLIEIRANYWLGRLELDSDAFDAALAHLARSASTAEELVLNHPKSNLDVKLWAARSRSWLARVESRRGRPEQAAKNYRLAREHYSVILPSTPDDAAILRDLAECEAAIAGGSKW